MKEAFNSARQDKTLKLLLVDTDFVKRVHRFLRPEYFGSPIQRNLCRGIFDFFDKYGVSPNFEQLETILSDMIRSKTVDVDEVDVYVTYIDRLMFDVEIDLIVKNHLLDNLKEFSRRRVLDIVEKVIKRDRDVNTNTEATFGKILQAVDEIRAIAADTSLISIRNLLKEDYYMGEVVSYFNIEEIDKVLDGGLQRGFFYVILGYTNAGKTWMLIHLGKMAARLGYLVLHIILELSNKVIMKRYKMAMSGEKASSLSKNYKKVGEVVRKSLLKRTNIIFVDEDEKTASVDTLSSLIENVVKDYGRKPDLILIDSAEDYLPPSGKKYKDEYVEEAAVMTFLKDFARTSDICVVTSVQAEKKGEKIYWLSAQHTSGSRKKIAKASVGISINRSPKEDALGYYRLSVFKNSEGGKGSPVWVRRNLKYGQMVLESGRWSDGYDERLTMEEEEEE